jgi:hypothetical protein
MHTEGRTDRHYLANVRIYENFCWERAKSTKVSSQFCYVAEINVGLCL